MATKDDLTELERSAWKALSTSGEAAAAYYSGVLADEILVLLPGGLVIDDRDRVIDSMRGDPWESFEMSDERVLELTDSSAVLVYRVTARRDGDDYVALLNSTYVRVGDDWRLALHQQTPV